MVDALNAEIALGTVTTVFEGVKWLGYTYLFVRMRKNPFVYGEFCPVCEDSSLSLFQVSLGRRLQTTHS